METLSLVFFLALFTLIAFLVFAYVNKRKTEEQLQEDRPPSSLAKDSQGPGAVERLDDIK
ncbi:MAG: hypothetical protein JJU09_02460 [Rhodobacteraceae bacterium]|nr:hypothetical protein [Paracoccaceae bacterium]TVR48806.1 MAG: hypothetical protein EA386_03860 [Paracoccaceae bacterium]